MNPDLSEECSPRSTRGKYPPLPAWAGLSGQGQPRQVAVWHIPALGDTGVGHGGCSGARLSQAGLSFQGTYFHGGCRFGDGVPRLPAVLWWNVPSVFLLGDQGQGGWATILLWSCLSVVMPEGFSASGWNCSALRKVHIRGEVGGQSSVEKKYLLWSFSFQQWGFSCNVRVCIPEQMLETGMSVHVCVLVPLRGTSFAPPQEGVVGWWWASHQVSGPLSKRDLRRQVGKILGSLRSSTKEGRQLGQEACVWSFGSFGKFDLLESLNADPGSWDQVWFKAVICQISFVSASLLHCRVFGPLAEEEMKSY